MKARVKATGEIVDVIAISDYINEFGQVIGEYKDANGILYISCESDFYIEEGITIPDYWTRLKHTYAGMAMQGLCANSEWDNCTWEVIANDAYEAAHALVEKFRNAENPKELEGLKRELEALNIEKTILENKVKLLKEERK